jgi:hypothetical protein
MPHEAVKENQMSYWLFNQLVGANQHYVVLVMSVIIACLIAIVIVIIYFWKRYKNHFGERPLREAGQSEAEYCLPKLTGDSYEERGNDSCFRIQLVFYCLFWGNTENHLMKD